jgi:hypothetical protein
MNQSHASAPPMMKVMPSFMIVYSFSISAPAL